MKKKISVIGLGNRGTEYMGFLKAFHSPKVEIHALCDIRQQALDDIAPQYSIPKERQFLSTEVFFAQGVISDALIISTQDASHYDITKQALLTGYKTILLEKQINLGGLGTVGLISWYEPLCDGNGKKMISGIGEELIKLAIKYGFDNLHSDWGGKGKNTPSTSRYATFYSPMSFSLALDEYVRESGADIRFDTLASYPVMDGNICLGVMAETVSGKEFYPAKMIIDATGDAQLAYLAGCPTVLGRESDHLCQPMTLCFRVGNVDVKY